MKINKHISGGIYEFEGHAAQGACPAARVAQHVARKTHRGKAMDAALKELDAPRRALSVERRAANPPDLAGLK